MIVRLGTVGSTMQEAARLAGEGAPHGTAVVAEEQTAGIGRQGHSWHSEPGLGLYVSLILRLALAPEALPLVTLALGVGAAEAILTATGLVCDIRWPNDLLIDGRKVAGILAQLVDGAVIAGIGVNVNHTEFPAELAALATSLRLASGRQQVKEPLLTALLASVENACQILMEAGAPPILRLFRDASSYAEGKRVQVDLGNERIQGVTAGLTDSGFLRVQTNQGKLVTVVAGGVRPL